MQVLLSVDPDSYVLDIQTDLVASILRELTSDPEAVLDLVLAVHLRARLMDGEDFITKCFEDFTHTAHSPFSIDDPINTFHALAASLDLTSTATDELEFPESDVQQVYSCVLGSDSFQIAMRRSGSVRISCWRFYEIRTTRFIKKDGEFKRVQASGWDYMLQVLLVD